MTLYAITIFLSAFLLFQVQPLIAKIILPWFGGSAAVWSASMLFFQLILLAGYGYAHLSIRFLKPRTQAILHAALLAVSCLLLPILPSPSWRPTGAGEDPTGRILGLLAATIGLPYLLLSSTSPLLQAWYVRRSGSTVPYRLFALSNFGSMLALVSFPFLVEPNLATRAQAYTWSGGYAAFVLVCAYAAWASKSEAVAPVAIHETEPISEPVSALEVREEADQAVPFSEPFQEGASDPHWAYSAVVQNDQPLVPKKPTHSGPPSFWDRTFWVLLAACASILLIAVTNHMSENVAPIPLLWVLPLALYLLTFILAFESDRIYKRWIFIPLMSPALAGMAYMIYAAEKNLNIKWAIPGFAAALFVCCMFCHGELARRRPEPRYLTLFYLMVSFGGALGGVFVALIAPRIFDTYMELPAVMVASGILAMIAVWNNVPRKALWPIEVILLLGVGALAGYFIRQEKTLSKNVILRSRNFYGPLEVRDDPPTQDYAQRTLLHGTINHGSQSIDPVLKYVTTSYYGKRSGVGRALTALQARGPIRAGFIGLGSGVLTNYGRKEDYIRVYEINPLIQRIAQTLFTFYPHSPADKAILMGDARLTLENQLAQGSQNYDLLAVDAFSSDAIPVHLLTREAVQLYFKHLKPDGVLALHISNRYLDLKPVCEAGATAVGRRAWVVEDEGNMAPYFSSSTWVLLTNDLKMFGSEAFVDAYSYEATAKKTFRPWTDDYSNLFQILEVK